MTLNCDYYLPLSDSDSDAEAVSRQFDFQLGWFANPLWFGDYPGMLLQGHLFDNIKQTLCESTLAAGSQISLKLNLLP